MGYIHGIRAFRGWEKVRRLECALVGPGSRFERCHYQHGFRWWDPFLEQEIRRCGENGNLAAFHICDWKVPTTDLLLDRGLMGEGCIPVKKIRSWVEAAGFNGFNEVEIFSNAYWKEDQADFLKKIIKSYKEHS